MGLIKKVEHSFYIVRQVPVNEREDVEHGGDVGVVVTAGFLKVLQRLLAEWHGHLIPALTGVLNHQVVQRAQACGDLVAATGR